MSVKVLANMYT